MSADTQDKGLYDIPFDIKAHRRIIHGELRDRSVWFIKLRWLVPPGIVGGTVLANVLGLESASGYILLAIAFFILAYNTGFHLWRRNFPETVDRAQRARLRVFTRWQVSFDYIAMFLLIHFTGGVGSPLIFFFIFHIIFASILLRPISAYGFSCMVVAGMAGIAVAEYAGWIPQYPIFSEGQAISLPGLPYHMLIYLGCFAASVFVTSASTVSIVTMLRKRINNLVTMSRTIDRLNTRLNALYVMVQAVGSERSLDKVLDIVTKELADIGKVMGVSVKLLSEDGRHLHMVAAQGPVTDIYRDHTIDIESSPISRMIIDGEPYVVGRMTNGELFQFADQLVAADVQSVLFVPLRVDGRVIGILGAYGRTVDRFNRDEIEFFRLAAGLSAITIEHARSYESIETLMKERSWFMMRVAHNLRAPLAAMLSMIEVVKGEYMGDLNVKQAEHLRRVYRRGQSMIVMINELLSLTEARNGMSEPVQSRIDLSHMAERIRRTFCEEARKKDIQLSMVIPDDLPVINADPDAIEQMLENLVSNGLKYTPNGGQVKVEFFRQEGATVRIQVSDNGIGIPRESLGDIFKEFYRSENARRHEDLGTGLGLAIVKQIVERHNGRVIVESEEGLGSLFVVHLPVGGATQTASDTPTCSHNGGHPAE